MSNLFNREEFQEQPSSDTHAMSPTRAVIRILAGGYLLYLLYEIIKGGGLIDNAGWKLVLMVVSLSLFAVFGVLFIIQGVKSITQMNKGSNTGNNSGCEESELPEKTEENDCSKEHEFWEENEPEDKTTESQE